MRDNKRPQVKSKENVLQTDDTKKHILISHDEVLSEEEYAQYVKYQEESVKECKEFKEKYGLNLL